MTDWPIGQSATFQALNKPFLEKVSEEEIKAHLLCAWTPLVAFGAGIGYVCIV